jgi:hypothetical protein
MFRHRLCRSRSSVRRLRAFESLEERRLLDANSLIGLNLFRADPRFAGIDGSGYSVVVIDHGADMDHPFFGPDLDGNGVADRIIAQFDFGDNDANAAEAGSIGHGTAVASVIGSQDAAFPGVAPGCNLIILKLFPSAPDAPSPSLNDLEKALQWVEQHAAQYNIVAVNLSITDSENYHQPEAGKVTADEFARLANKGVIVVAAAGNDFATLNSAPGVGYPAADPNVIAVSGVWADNYGPQDFSGAINNSTGADQVTAFSQRDPVLTDVFAPAGMVVTAASGGGITSRRGTSFSTPFVTGAVVLAQQLAERELGRRLTFNEMSDRLRTTGFAIHDGDDEDDNVTNTDADYRRLDMLALGDSILVNPGSPVLSITDVTISEGSSGTATAQVVVKLSRQPQVNVTVRYATADGSATAADNDYAQVSGLLAFFPGGPLSRTISIPVTSDTRFEPTESFHVNLSAALNADVLNPTATITILDDDVSRPWQNLANALDVNNTGTVTGLDALIIINRLNATGPETLPTTTPIGPFFFYDVTGDGRVTALDALRVINHLNSVAAGSGASVAAAGDLAGDPLATPPDQLATVGSSHADIAAPVGVRLASIETATAGIPFSSSPRASRVVPPPGTQAKPAAHQTDRAPVLDVFWADYAAASDSDNRLNRAARRIGTSEPLTTFGFRAAKP